MSRPEEIARHFRQEHLAKLDEIKTKCPPYARIDDHLRLTLWRSVVEWGKTQGTPKFRSSDTITTDKSY